MDNNAYWRVLTFKLERSDFLRLMLHGYLNLKTLFVGLICLFPLAYVFAAKALFSYGDWSYLGYTTLVTLAIRYLYFPLLEYRLLGTQLKRSTMLDQVTQVTIDLLTLRSDREDARMVWRWAKVDNLRNTKAAIYVKVNAAHTVIIPARAFESRDEQDRFFKTIHGYWRAGVQAALKAKKPKRE